MGVATEKQNFTQDLVQAIDLKQFANAADLRENAFNAFKKTGLPEAKAEEYKFTPVTRMLSKHFEPGQITSTPPPAIEKVGDLVLKEFKDNVIVFVNGVFNKALSRINEQPGITIKSLGEAMKSDASLVHEALAKVENGSDAFALLNASIWQDGVFIHVADNVIQKEPLLIQHLHDVSVEKVAAHTRLLVSIQKNASFSLIEKTDSKGDHAVFNTVSEEIVVEENANFTYYKIQNDPGQLIQVTNTTIKQKNSSNINTYTFTLSGKLIRNNLNIIVDGEGCESHFYGLYLTNGDSLVDNHTVVDHKQPHCYSNELYKGLMDGKSKGVFNGKIYVRPYAQKTNAFQSNRNILLSETASVNTKPQLEIWADDVKCSHGCTTGQLDDEALFYLRSRGIPKSTAKAMLLYAFVGEVIDVIKDEKVKAYVDSIVSERLHKGF